MSGSRSHRQFGQLFRGIGGCDDLLFQMGESDSQLARLIVKEWRLRGGDAFVFHFEVIWSSKCPPTPKLIAEMDS